MFDCTIGGEGGGKDVSTGGMEVEVFSCII